MSPPEEEDSILQKSVIPNLLEEEFKPAALTAVRDDLIPREDQHTANLTGNDDDNLEMDKINEVTSYKRKLFQAIQAGVDFRKTLGSFCKKLIKWHKTSLS